MVTNMPFWAEKIGVPRTLAVEFPLGHILGQPHNTQQQMRVIRQALDVLQHAKAPGTIVHSQEIWPAPFEDAIEDCHPETAPPIAADMGRYIGASCGGCAAGACSPLGHRRSRHASRLAGVADGFARSPTSLRMAGGGMVS